MGPEESDLAFGNMAIQLRVVEELSETGSWVEVFGSFALDERERPVRIIDEIAVEHNFDAKAIQINVPGLHQRVEKDHTVLIGDLLEYEIAPKLGAFQTSLRANGIL